MLPVLLNWVTAFLLISHGAAQNFQPSLINGNFPIIFPLPPNNNQHNHASISHSHTGQTHNAHHNLPMTEQPNSNTHRHGSMIHSHFGSQIHSHANLPQSVDVQQIGNIHAHGSVSHSHGGLAMHYHPNLPMSSQNLQLINTRHLEAGAQGVIDNQHIHSHGNVGPRERSHINMPASMSNLHQTEPKSHNHGSTVHSHLGPQEHTHSNTLGTATDMNQNGQQTHSHGNVVHSHVGPRVHSHPNLPVTATEKLNTPRTLSHGSTTHTHGGPREHSHINMPDSRSNLHPTEPRSHGNTVHPHPGPMEHTHSNTLGSATDMNQNGQQTHSHGNVVHSHIGQIVYAHPNLPASNMNHRIQQNVGRMDVLTGSPQQWHSQNILNTNVNSRRNEAFRNLLKTRGFASPRTDRRQIGQNYQLAGGASCQSQCKSGVASKSCYCARYMCYYQGCSSDCNLIREGTNIRAECQQPKTVALNNLNTPRCQQPKDPGTCNSRLYTRYAFDSQSQTCVRFIYSGCGGNKNRFTSRNSCLSSCAQL